MRGTELRPQDLQRAVEGDLEALSVLFEHPHGTLQKCRAELRELVLTAASVRKVPEALKFHTASPDLAQQWASFVRRGFIAGRTRGPIMPIEIDYEASVEEEIVHALSRLDEISDLVDGEIGDEEVAELLQSPSSRR